MTATNQPDQSPAPGLVPAPAYPSSNAVAPAAKPQNPNPGRRNPLMVVAARVMSALRGDKYMVDAYPPAAPEHPVASDHAGSEAQEL